MFINDKHNNKHVSLSKNEYNNNNTANQKNILVHCKYIKFLLKFIIHYNYILESVKNITL